MRVVEEIRRYRLELLRQEFGSWAELNKKMNLVVNDSTLSQIYNQSRNIKDGKESVKTMGSPMARKLEAATGKPAGWMDNDPDLWPFKTIDPALIRELPDELKERLETTVRNRVLELRDDDKARVKAKEEGERLQSLIDVTEPLNHSAPRSAPPRTPAPVEPAKKQPPKRSRSRSS